MLTLYPYEDLGQADYGWLKARYHFSFARYANRARMGFGALRVINDDIVAGGHGFGAHPHDNMEIITYVRQGAITHGDNMGNKGRTEAGDVQVMSAGSGVMHSEQNDEGEDAKLYQIWIIPDKSDVQPRWEQRSFPKTLIAEGVLPVLVSGRAEDRGKGALFIHQDASISGGRLKKGASVKQPIKHQAYILAPEGKFTVNGQTMKKGDGAETTDKELQITALEDCEILVIDVPG